MDFPTGEDVTRQRGVAVVDPYSEESTALDWTTPATVTYPRCAVWQETSTEPTQDGRAAVITVTKVALPADADVRSADRFVARGKTYEVQGEPEIWHSPFTGWEPGVVVTGRLVAG